MISTETPYKDGEWVRSGLIEVHSGMGWVRQADTKKPISIFRDVVNGIIRCLVPREHGIKGLAKGRYPYLNKLILVVLQEGSPYSKPRSEVIIHRDGNKWNNQPDNLQWLRRNEVAYRHVVTNNFPLKLNSHLALTLRHVVTRLKAEKIKDLDAIGSVFRITAGTVQRVIHNKTWYYVDEFVEKVTTKASDQQYRKAKGAVELYATYDRKLKEYMLAAA